VGWEIFEREAHGYEDWYETSHGRRAALAEEALLSWLLNGFPETRTVLEVGCGSGHFTGWLSERGLRATGLDRAPAMLAEARRRLPDCPLVLSDAHRLPFRDRAVDLVLFVTTLEFLASPERAAAEAARVARRGVVALVLNRWSAGAVSRRWGRESRSALLARARDFAASEVRSVFVQAAGDRVQQLRLRSTLLPVALRTAVVRVPFGNVLGVAAALAE
jgi:ubiquinone/menaquinone biosynthesis C-methylase UbiE